MRQLYLLFAITFLFINAAFSQSFELGSWNILNVKYHLNKKWNVFGEAQLRSLKFYDDFHYHEYKGGIETRLGKNVRVALGAGSYQTYKEGGNFVKPKNNDEFRLWPQLILLQPLGKLKLEQRYRAEFRFTNNGFRNRFRYRLGVLFPFGKERDQYKPFQINLSNEIFLTNTAPFFERNRLLLALSYKPTKAAMLQMGYLHQFDYKINDETGRDFFLIGYYIELFRQKPANQGPVVIPSTAD